MIKLAIVSPCYNEEEVLEESTTRLTALFDDLVAKKKISADSFVLFVNDGSKDRTWSIIKQLHRTNPYIKGMNLARNVGHQYAIMAGMMTAKDWSDAVITIDADLQDDLNAIEEMIDAYTQGYDVVYGVKVSRQADPMLKRLSATAFYKLQHRMGVETIYNHADFRFLSRRVLEQLSHYQERNVYLRGIGITNILRTVQAAFPESPCKLLLGGFHIHNAEKQKYQVIADYLQEYLPRQIGVCHCTGVDKYAFFYKDFGDSTFYNYTGKLIQTDLSE